MPIYNDISSDGMLMLDNAPLYRDSTAQVGG